jgi:hypothetical protein
MKQRTLLTALPLFLAAPAAFAQAPAAPAPAAAAPAPAAAAPAPAAAAPAAAPTTAPAGEQVPAAAPPAPTQPVAAPAEPAKAEEAPAAPDKVTVSKTGFFQPSANLQVWAVAEHLGNARTDDNAWQSSFRIRRAEIKAKGEIIPKTVSYMVMFDPARLLDLQPVTTTTANPDGTTKTDTQIKAPALGGSSILTGANTSILQDVQLTYMTDYADVSVGQFKIPVSLEGSGSASKLYFPERHVVSRFFGDVRDMGIKVEKKFDKFGYLFGIYNGQGQNNLDTNDQKDFALRLEAYPVKGLTVAAVGYTSVGDQYLANTKRVIEGDVKYESNGILLQAEAIRGWKRPAKDANMVESQGFYILAGYTFFDKLQPAVRIGSIDPEVGVDEHGATAIDKNDEINTYEAVVNYYLKQHDAKLQLSGSFFDPEQKSQHTTFDLILAAQVAF